MRKFLPPLFCMVFLTGTAVFCEAAKSSPKQLKPIRETVQKGDITVDTVGDKNQKKDSETIRIILRIKGENKKPIKPREIVLVDPDGKIIEADDRDDCKTGDEKGSGLPVTVSPSVSSGGGSNVGVGLDLGKLFGGGGEYSYTKVDFFRKDFVSGMKLKLILPEKKEIVIPLTTIAE